MMDVSQQHFEPDIPAILIHGIGSDQLSVRKFLKNPSFGGILGGKVTFDLQNAKMLWPSTRCGTLLPHASTGNLDSGNNVTLLCFIAERSSAVQSGRPFKPYESRPSSP